MKQMTRRPSIDDTDKASYCSSKPRIHHRFAKF
ncbi:hypothetical protein CsSME_00041610 [Camellia sinensis var. sinensis]